MRRWTREEDNVIRAYGHMGAAKVVRLLALRLGSRRTQKAVERRASRIGASLVEYEVCVGCGRRVRRAWPDGLCDVCHERRLLQLTRERCRTLAEREGDADYEAQAKAVHAERAVWRAEISRGKGNV